MQPKTRLLIWELGCVFWICFAGSSLHFAFELSDYWTPLALVAAVNESVWEHLKIYFWPGLLYALVQYTYTRQYANNYWLGKVVALVITPIVITVSFEAYMSWVIAEGGKSSVGLILGIMTFGVLVGQLCSWKILSSDPWQAPRRYIMGGYASLVFSFSMFTFFPPQVFLFENYLCYESTKEYGILADYTPYRMFRKPDEVADGGNSIWYCQTGGDNELMSAY
jgi:hypothetical protein